MSAVDLARLTPREREVWEEGYLTGHAHGLNLARAEELQDAYRAGHIDGAEHLRRLLERLADGIGWPDTKLLPSWDALRSLAGTEVAA